MLGLGLALTNFGSKGGIADVADGGSLAALLLANETQGLAIDFTDLSMRIKDTGTPANSFAGDPNTKLTYASPSTKWILNKSGIYESGTTLRTEYDTSGNPLGIRVEEARTELCLQNSDFTNASWTKSNMTTAKTATGADGTANSASTLTATAGNATALQAITSGSAARITGCFIKRRTGSGNIDITQDNGATWTTVTVTASWAQVGIASVTSANPTVGIRIVTSGDAVDVMWFTHQLGTFLTSPIVTAGSTVTRAADAINFSAFTWNENASTLYTKGRLLDAAAFIGSGTMIAQVSLTANSGFAGVMIFTDSTKRYDLRVRQDGGSSTIFATSAVNSGLSPGAFDKLAVAHITGDSAGYQNAAQAGTSATAHATTTLQTMGIGGSPAGGFHSNGYIAQIMYLPRRMTNAELVTVTT